MGKIASIFRAGIEEGKFISANANALADLFWGTFSGLVLWEESKRRINPQKDFLEPTLELGFDLLLRGISKK